MRQLTLRQIRQAKLRHHLMLSGCYHFTELASQVCGLFAAKMRKVDARDASKQTGRRAALRLDFLGVSFRE